MNERFNLSKSAKYIVLAVFLILAIISVMLFGKVGINYNISDYLDDETDTKISLGIMEEEFGLISNIQVMIEDIGVDEAEKIKSTIKAVENVVFVNFDSQNSDYYKDGTALFVILVNGSEYSDIAIQALEDIKNALSDDYGSKMEIGGAVIEKQLLRKAIQGEIVMILAISLCLVAVLMLIMAGSWIEPLVLLAAAGVAVLINMGTNVIFGEISYITNAVAAILQLALSMDYSIVLLHAYRQSKNEEADNERAMLRAIKEVVKPVSASALTTIAGLLALLFMSFTIGFDIGIVLMKSIVISAITALTLLPALLLILDKLMQKTAKKPLVISGTKLGNFSMRAGKVIMPIAFFAVVLGCVLNIGNSYNFVDSCNSNEKISDKFGQSGTLIVLYENCEDSEEKEKILISLLESYKNEDGGEVLKSAVSYSNTIGQVFDVEKASRDLGISLDDAKLLFTIYRFTEDNSAVKMDVNTFVKFAIEFIQYDEDASEFVRPEYREMIGLLSRFDEMLDESYTADELSEILLTLEDLEEIEGIEVLAQGDMLIKQLYGNRFFDGVKNKKVNTLDMINFLINSGYLDEQTKAQLEIVPKAYGKYKDLGVELPHPDLRVDFAKFNKIINDFAPVLEGVDLGFDITSPTAINTVWIVALGYKPTYKTESQMPMFKDVFAKFISRYGDLLPENIKYLFSENALGTYDYEEIYAKVTLLTTTIEADYDHLEFTSAIEALVSELLGGEGDIIPENVEYMVKQLYIMYYAENGRLPNEEMTLMDMVDYVEQLVNTDPFIASLIPQESRPLLSTLNGDIDKLYSFLKDTAVYTYEEMVAHIEEFIDSLDTFNVTDTLSPSAIMGLYVKYAAAKDAIETGEISGENLLNFVLNAAENNELLAGRIDGEMKKVIEESMENMSSAEKLLTADNYSRVLLTVNLPPESEESSKFVEYLSAKVREVFGEGAYVAGEIATTNDLIKAFDYDNKFISIFTVVSIFLIIMIIFKSLSLPIILVAVIQGAIWIAMAMSLVSGPMFFMSYIMSMCILMGATIDYGILLSTNYTRNRATLSKEESLQRAIDAAIPTVFTSGLILMVCGLVVGLIATQTSISSVGFLLFRGTLVSVIMVMLVLPAVLYLLDSFVIKFTMNQEIKPILIVYEKIRNNLTKKNSKEQAPEITESTQTDEQSE